MPMILKLGVKHLGIEHYKVYINHDPGMTLTYFTASNLKHLGMELYKVYINHDPGMTLTYFTARST